jgi:hypothetical protein
MQFEAEFDRVGLSLSLGSILILLYFGLTNPAFISDYWVAFAFWLTGFTGSILFFTRRTMALNLDKIVMIAVMASLTMLAFAGINVAYAMLAGQQIFIDLAFTSFAFGVAEELFFGVFLLGTLINWVGLNPVLAILISSGVHSFYHVPTWGQNPMLLMLFFTCFVVARSLYVFVYPKVGFLVGAHGFWNLGVGA